MNTMPELQSAEFAIVAEMSGAGQGRRLPRTFLYCCIFFFSRVISAAVCALEQQESGQILSHSHKLLIPNCIGMGSTGVSNRASAWHGS